MNIAFHNTGYSSAALQARSGSSNPLIIQTVIWLGHKLAAE
jgi:hypothetical protein